ncbi:hypothetical protein KM043_006875 [Ampulex compressa]|nr:hypothetical protein KM043_006875 [Ampulex compressa]
MALTKRSFSTSVFLLAVFSLPDCLARPRGRGSGKWNHSKSDYDMHRAFKAASIILLGFFDRRGKNRGAKLQLARKKAPISDKSNRRSLPALNAEFRFAGTRCALESDKRRDKFGLNWERPDVASR